MAFIKLQTDAFINPKVRRLSDGAFRMWVYLLGQAWVEGPGKPAGLVRVRGIHHENEDHAIEAAARAFGGASGADEGSIYSDSSDRHPSMINELENVGLIHITAERVGTSVGTSGTGPNAVPDGVWDIEIEMHDWAHHNPRKPPSHTAEGEAERKRNYRDRKKNNANAKGASSPKRPKVVVPSVPTTDKDLDSDEDKDLDNQPAAQKSLAGESLLLRSLRERLTADLNLPSIIHAGSSETQAFMQSQIDAVGLECLITDCRKCADLSKAGVPSSLNFFPGWLKRLPLPKVLR
jgi:hypothetical protein